MVAVAVYFAEILTGDRDSRGAVTSEDGVSWGGLGRVGLGWVGLASRMGNVTP